MRAWEILVSAQRLPASQEKSRIFLPSNFQDMILVLNAFRHHRKNHRNYPAQMTVAAGAQRLPASQEKSRIEEAKPMRLRLLCSTPSGITGKITFINPPQDSISGKVHPSNSAQRLPASQEKSRRRRRKNTAIQTVLNAFRHHRKNHRTLVYGYDVGPRCSTPSGITGKITPHTRMRLFE